jgi:sugar lactone lactonase YvrE
MPDMVIDYVRVYQKDTARRDLPAAEGKTLSMQHIVSKDILAVAGRPFYVSNEAESSTFAFDVCPDGTLSNARLFAEDGGESLAVDTAGNVYIAAGNIHVFDPAGRHIDTIKTPQRPISIIFGGEDRKTLFIASRDSLYSVRIR